METEPLFADRDLGLIESLEYNPELKPRFDHMRECLVWSDEEPSGLTPSGYDALCDLWIARSFLHRGLDFSTYEFSPDYFRTIWDRAIAQGLRWPGFNRLTLNEEDRDYYEKMLADNDEI